MTDLKGFVHEEPYIFVGQDGSMGLRHGGRYHVSRFDRGGFIVAEWRVGVTSMQCPYSSEDTFAANWKRLPCERKECVEARAAAACVSERLADIEEAHRITMSENCPTDEVHCTCVPELRRELAIVFRALSVDCGFRGSYITDENGREEEYDETSCNAQGIAECCYDTCPVIRAERDGIEYVCDEQSEAEKKS